MKLRQSLARIIATLILVGFVSGFLYLYSSCSEVKEPKSPAELEAEADDDDRQYLRIIYQNWKDHHPDIIRKYGEPGELNFVDIRFQNFSKGYITYDLTSNKAIIFVGKTGEFERLSASESMLLTVGFDLNKQYFEELMSLIPPKEKEVYRSLAYARINNNNEVGLVGGIGALYLREQLYGDLGPPLANEQKLGQALYAKGENYDLIVGLPIGGDEILTASNRGGMRRIVILYPDDHFEDYKEPPPVFKKLYKIPVVSALLEFYEKYNQKPWFWLLSVLGGFLITYLLGIAALLLLAWRRGSIIFSRTFLISIAAKPLLIAPVLGKRVLLLGYKRRLSGLRIIQRVSKKYFGLPAEDSIGFISWSRTGEILHERIAQALGPQQPVLLIGKGGAGKSTVLRRLTYLAIENRLPSSLNGFTPLLIPASYYDGTLTRAIADTLRARDGVAVDEEIIKGQMQSGKFLILFDGVSEAIVPMQEALEEILRIARHADYRNCRFIISTRPPDSIPPDVSIFTLHPLDLEAISDLLQYSNLSTGHMNQVLRQLKHFGQKPIDPLLLSMFQDSEDQQISFTRSQVYERYFRELLRVKEDDSQWSGWQNAGEILSLHTLINTGRRGVGLPHEHLMNLLDEGEMGAETKESLSSRLRRWYHLPISDELDLLNKLKAASLLLGGRRWSFAHDTFEEFFAASYLVSFWDLHEEWPSLEKWKKSPEQEQAFIYVLEFVREMIDETSKENLLRTSLPESWRRCLAEIPDLIEH